MLSNLLKYYDTLTPPDLEPTFLYKIKNNFSGQVISNVTWTVANAELRITNFLDNEQIPA